MIEDTHRRPNPRSRSERTRRRKRLLSLTKEYSPVITPLSISPTKNLLALENQRNNNVVSNLVEKEIINMFQLDSPLGLRNFKEGLIQELIFQLCFKLHQKMRTFSIRKCLGKGKLTTGKGHEKNIFFFVKRKFFRVNCNLC